MRIPRSGLPPPGESVPRVSPESHRHSPAPSVPAAVRPPRGQQPRGTRGDIAPPPRRETGVPSPPGAVPNFAPCSQPPGTVPGAAPQTRCPRGGQRAPVPPLPPGARRLPVPSGPLPTPGGGASRSPPAAPAAAAVLTCTGRRADERRRARSRSRDRSGAGGAEPPYTAI